MYVTKHIMEFTVKWTVLVEWMQYVGTERNQHLCRLLEDRAWRVAKVKQHEAKEATYKIKGVIKELRMFQEWGVQWGWNIHEMGDWGSNWRKILGPYFKECNKSLHLTSGNWTKVFKQGYYMIKHILYGSISGDTRGKSQLGSCGKSWGEDLK